MADAASAKVSADDTLPPQPSRLRAFWSAFAENRGAVVGLAVVLLIAVVLNYFGRDTLNDLIKKERKGDQGAVVA